MKKLFGPILCVLGLHKIEIVTIPYNEGAAPVYECTHCKRIELLSTFPYGSATETKAWQRKQIEKPAK